MIIMDVKADNFYAFKNFHMNMSYPKKIVNSYIEDEFLEGHENFRYKKINVLLGGNASGKTTFGKMLMNMFNFIEKKEYSYLTRMINDVTKNASFSLDMVIDGETMHRIETDILPPSDEDYEIADIQVRVKNVTIGKKDRYETCALKLDGMECDCNRNYIEELGKVPRLTWYFMYPADAGAAGKKYRMPKSARYLGILGATLKALDPSIKKVQKLKTSEASYEIVLGNRSILMQNGELLNKESLSSGTIAGIRVADMVASIITGGHDFYYCDEKFSYIHSDMEKAFLSVMIQKLAKNKQLFFTTHNTDILDMALPMHTFTFLKKDVDDEQTVRCVYASDYLKRNTDSLRNAVINDLFSVAPSVDKVLEIADM